MTDFTRLNEPLAEHPEDSSEAERDRRQAEEEQAELDASGPPFDQDIDPDGLDAFSPALCHGIAIPAPEEFWHECGCDDTVALKAEVDKLKSEIRWRDALLDEICRWAVAGNNAEVAAMFRGRNRG